MAVDSKKYLAENVLNERRTVTYRLLSRALKVHSHAAKRMLYEFHHNENFKKPSSVNATYVITGVQQRPEPPATSGDAHESDADGDDIMQSSPYVSGSMSNQDAVVDSVAAASIILVREEDLEDAKATFQSISSIHVYSLQPTILQDLNVLTDVSREMLAAYAHEDPSECGGQWGMIQNKNVKRRTGARPPPVAASTGPSNTASSNPTVPAKRPLQKEPPSQPKPESSNPAEPAESKQQSEKESSQPPSKPTAKTAPLKKEKSNLFNSFAKAKPKQKKEESSTPAASGAESADPSGAEDANLGNASEEEPEELFANTEKLSSTSNRDSRKDRQDKLKKMMEDDDDEQANGEADQEMKDADSGEPEEEPEEPEEPPLIDQPPPASKQPELKEEVTVQGGRRRGKRQVLKKKTVKDDEGYLVTVEEPTWESFSEDESELPPAKKKPAVSAPKPKPGAKPGQGNIMSFFAKKSS